MKKELSLVLQFSLIVLLTGLGVWGIVIIVDPTMVSFWTAYAGPFTYWFAVFLGLAVVRLLIFLVVKNPSTFNSKREGRIHVLDREIWTTVQYLVIAIGSIILSFYIPVLLAPENISINVMEMWFGLRETFFYWFVGFLILSLARLGAISLKNGQNAV